VAVVAAVAWVIFGPNDDIIAYGSFAGGGGPERVEGTVVTGDGWTRRDVFFPTLAAAGKGSSGGSSGGVGNGAWGAESRGELLHGWFYRPAGAFRLVRTG